jgi:Domain of unknown function (DUF6265)
MKQLLLLALFIAAGIAKAGAQTYSQKEFNALHGLAGLWKMETKRGPLYEEWKVLPDGKLYGRSYKINNKDTMVLERVEITLKGNNILYTPVVTGQNNEQPVPFNLSVLTGKKYVFENKEHDYPQRVIYNIVSKEVLKARIEGTNNGKEMSSDFTYSRVK